MVPGYFRQAQIQLLACGSNLPLKRGGRFARQSKAGGDLLSPLTPVSAADPHPDLPPFRGKENSLVARLPSTRAALDEFLALRANDLLVDRLLQAVQIRMRHAKLHLVVPAA
ncbi:hypothetical protein BE61_03710 [Bradyrhizobium elkanii USDA 61]|nr:hypothetical protein BE61_03710 [Bradyrhizobium elkanii USDA 61]